MPYSNQRATNVTYSEIKVPENSRKTFDHFESESIGGIYSEHDVNHADPNFISLYSLRKNKMLNSIISFENLGKMCQFEDCKKIASVVNNDKVKGLKTILCMKHAKRIAAVHDIFSEENDLKFTIKLYHPYMVSITCEMDHMLGSVYRMKWSMCQHDVSLTEYETDKLKRNSCDSDSRDPLFRLDVKRNDSYLMSKQKVHCMNGIIRYVNDCSRTDLTNN